MEVSKREKDVGGGGVELSKEDTFWELKEVCFQIEMDLMSALNEILKSTLTEWKRLTERHLIHVRRAKMKKNP